MAVWTIKSGTGSGTLLVGYRIVDTHSAGHTTYEFLPPVGVGSTPYGTDTVPSADPPSFVGMIFKGQTWNVGSTTPAPNPAPPGTKWRGSCGNSAIHFNDPGTWTAEASGGVGFGEDEDEDENGGEDQDESEEPDDDEQ
jgi:hypothetical protein